MIKILCVEDETDLRTLLHEVLEEEGYTVVSACNGAEGLRAMEQFAPDIVMTDWLMPQMNGIEMIRAMRSEGSRFSTTPVIVVSAYAGKAEIDEALAMGACRYLTKPVDFGTLLASIKEFAEHAGAANPVDCGCRAPLSLMAEGD